MHPLFISFGNFHLYWLSVCTVIGWLVFSFLFWRSLRRIGINEDTTFDLTFYATIVGIFFARLGFIVFHQDVFTGKSFLLWFTLWVAPGLSWTGAFVGVLATIVLLSRQYKVRLGQVLDAVVGALPIAFVIGAIGTLLDGSQSGKVTSVSWAIVLHGKEGLRHPIDLYQMIAIIIVSAFFFKMGKVGEAKKWPYGIVSVWFIFTYSFFMFLIEFMKESRVYFGNITVNQWIYIVLIAECIGVLYVRGGGREKVRPFFYRVHKRFVSLGVYLYDKISRRRLTNDQKTS